jgi:tetratricopeptide (TPR) repeat protein/uncharacterized caspase-like protein
MTEVIPILERYIELEDRPSKNAYTILTRLYRQNDQPEKAAEMAEKAIGDLSSRPKEFSLEELQNQRLNALNRTGRTERAMQAYREQIERNPENTAYRYNYGSLLLKADRYDEAAEQLQKAVELDPIDPKKHYNLGAAYLNKGVVLQDNLVSVRDAIMQKDRAPTQEERQMVKDLDEQRRALFRKAIPPLERARQLSGADGQYRQYACWALFQAYVQTEQPEKAEEVKSCADAEDQTVVADRNKQAPEDDRDVSPPAEDPSSTEKDPRSTDQNADPNTFFSSTSVSIDTQAPETAMRRPNAVAVVIGNKTYRNEDIPDVKYAARDAQTVKKYLTRTLGVGEENVIYVENATAAALTRIFGTADDPEGQLHNWVKPGESEVFVYYSGHGAPSPESGQAYLVPSDANPNYLSQNGYPARQLYGNLAKVPAKSVTLMLEACFSGVSEGGAVLQRASPVELSVENPVMALDDGLAFTAGAADQIASWYPEKKHGLFTYFFLKGLRGPADWNGDRAITSAEMGQYLTEKVPYRARRMYNREQTPQVVGQTKNRVLVRYDDNRPSN